jgi:hypothetical protein
LGCGDPISGTCIGGTNNEGYCSIGGSSQCPGGTCAICIGQECISFDDISADVDAFKGIAYPCSAPCP